jgi:uncharacterized integral membrane protein
MTMGLAKVRLAFWVIVVAAIVTFVLTSTTPTKVEFSFFGNKAVLSASIVVFLSLAAGFVLGYLFRVTRFVRKKPPKKPQK